MCDNCTKRAIGRIIYDAEAKLNKAFAELDKGTVSVKDEEFISLANRMADLLDKYKRIRE